MARTKKDVGREIVAAAPPQAAYALPLPQCVGELSLASTATMEADVRASISSALGCNFVVADGVLTAADGRVFGLRVSADRNVELVPA